MKITTPFTLINRKCNEMDLVRDAIKERKLTTEKLHNYHKKMYKTNQSAY